MLGIFERLNQIESFKSWAEHHVLTSEHKTILSFIKSIQKTIENNKPAYSSRSTVVFPISNFVIKPVGNICNLGCCYCLAKIHKSTRRYFESNMSIGLVEEIILQMARYCSGRVSIIWTGGEVLLAGIDFFKKVIGIQKNITTKNKHIEIVNKIQTNAVMLNQRWIDFLKQNDFRVSLSLDGSERDHNRSRTYRNFSGTYKDVIRGIRMLRQANMDFGTIATIIPAHSRDPAAFIKTFLDLGITRLLIHQSFDEAMLLSPEDFADFMIALFDAWLLSGEKIRIVNFEDIFYSLMGAKATVCSHNGNCGKFPCIEPNGDVWICDLPFTSEDYCFGNISDYSLAELFSSDKCQRFFEIKSEAYRKCLLSCKWFYVCLGDCLYNYAIRNNGIVGPKSYYCKGLSKIFYHIISKFDRIITLRAGS